jgi:hypothetical protein
VLSSRHVRPLSPPNSAATRCWAEASCIATLPSRGDLAVRWTARVLGLLGFLFVLMFILAEGVPAFWSQPVPVRIELAGMVAMMVGLLVGWRLERLGAALIVAGWLVFAFIEHGRPPVPFTAFLAVAALYAYSGWRRVEWGAHPALSAATSDVPIQAARVRLRSCRQGTGAGRRRSPGTDNRAIVSRRGRRGGMGSPLSLHHHLLCRRLGPRSGRSRSRAAGAGLVADRAGRDPVAAWA